LVTKLANLFDVKDIPDYTLATEKALNLGEKSYHSYFEQFKSIFNKDTYHHGYYIGKELAAKPRL